MMWMWSMPLENQLQRKRSVSRFIFNGTPWGPAAAVAVEITADFFIFFLPGLHFWDFSLKLTLVQLCCSLCVTVSLSDHTTANMGNYTTKHHTMSSVMLITRGPLLLSGLDAGPVGLGVKWFEHLWGRAIHKIRSPSDDILYIHTHWNAFCPIKMFDCN